jgi:hypothetical protein
MIIVLFLSMPALLYFFLHLLSVSFSAISSPLSFLLFPFDYFTSLLWVLHSTPSPLHIPPSLTLLSSYFLSPSLPLSPYLLPSLFFSHSLSLSLPLPPPLPLTGHGDHYHAIWRCWRTEREQSWNCRENKTSSIWIADPMQHRCYTALEAFWRSVPIVPVWCHFCSCGLILECFFNTILCLCIDVYVAMYSISVCQSIADVFLFSLDPSPSLFPHLHSTQISPSFSPALLNNSLSPREKSDAQSRWGFEETEGEAKCYSSRPSALRLQWYQGRSSRGFIWDANKV